MVSERFAVEEALVEELDRACLDTVLTIKEVASLYHKNVKTVYDLCQSGKLVCRKANFGSTWLISKRSCAERWSEDGSRNKS